MTEQSLELCIFETFLTFILCVLSLELAGWSEKCKINTSLNRKGTIPGMKAYNLFYKPWVILAVKKLKQKA